MQTTLDAIVNARLPGREGLFHIPVSGGRFGQIAPQAQMCDAAPGQLARELSEAYLTVKNTGRL